LKKEFKIAAFFLSLLIINLPFALPATQGSQTAELPADESAIEFYSTVLKTGTGVANMQAVQENEKRELSIASLLNFELPVLSYFKELSARPEGIKGYSTVAINPPGYDAKESIDTEAQYHNENPLVLIYHTHTTESYDVGSGETRSDDPQIGVVAVGSQIAKVLYEKYGIEVYHITEIFDHEYEAAYSRSLAAAEAVLEKYPSIEYVFDVHRDAVSTPTEETRAMFVSTIADSAAASIETVIGMKAEYAKQNVAFETEIKDMMEAIYPGLFKKSIHYDNYKYNQFLKPHSLLFEIGSNQTTPEEAQYSGVLLGDVIGRVIKNAK